MANSVYALPRHSYRSESSLRARYPLWPPGTFSSATQVCGPAVAIEVKLTAALLQHTLRGGRCWTGRYHHSGGWSNTNMAFRSALTIAGGAALWGLIVLSHHLLWSPPRRGLLTITPPELPNSASLEDPASTSLQEVVHHVQHVVYRVALSV